jgi:hypothetical protein
MIEPDTASAGAGTSRGFIQADTSRSMSRWRVGSASGGDRTDSESPGVSMTVVVELTAGCPAAVKVVSGSCPAFTCATNATLDASGIH